LEDAPLGTGSVRGFFGEIELDFVLKISILKAVDPAVAVDELAL